MSIRPIQWCSRCGNCYCWSIIWFTSYPPIIRIINTGQLKVKADIAENYASIIRTGSNAKLIFPDILTP